MKTLQEIRRYFEQDQFAMQLGFEILCVESEKTVCRVVVPESQKNALGRVQGGFLFTLADFTFAVAANVRSVGTVTMNSTIHFLAPPKGDLLLATARPKQLGKRICVYEVDVCDEEGTCVATAICTGYGMQIST